MLYLLSFKNETALLPAKQGRNCQNPVAEPKRHLASSARRHHHFPLLKKIGIDPYSKDFDKSVSELISLSVNGSGEDLIGFGGDYDKYLEHLKEMNMNYSVQDLLFRYELASAKIFEYYAGYSGEFIEESTSGNLKYSEADVKEFYFSGDCVRVLKAYLSKDWFSYEDAVTAREKIIEQANYGETKVAEKIIGLVGTFAPSTVFCGDIIGRHNLDDAYYAELEKTREEYEKRREEEPTLPKFKSVDYKFDGTEHFYIPEDKRIAAEVKFANRGMKMWSIPVIIVVSVVGFFGLMLLVPYILQLLDQLIGSFNSF